MTTVPVRAEEITSGWLNSLLSAQGWPVIQAVRTERLPGANPKITQIFRAHLSFAADGVPPARTLIVKIPAADPRHREHESANRVYEREMGVYRLLAAHQGNWLPRLIAAQLDPATGDGAMLLEDLGPSAPESGRLPPGWAAPVVDSIAGLHAPFWESPALASTPWLRGPTRLDLWGDPPDLYAPGWERLSGRRDIGNSLRRIGDALVTRLPAVLAELERRPRTLVHADLHPGNLMWRAEPGCPVIIDWQGAAFAGGTSDIAKLLLHTSASYMLQHEAGLLASYHVQLESAGVSGYRFDRFERDYRLAQAAIFANYAIISPPARAPAAEAKEIPLGRSLKSVSAAISAVFPHDFEWP